MIEKKNDDFIPSFILKFDPLDSIEANDLLSFVISLFVGNALAY